MINATSPGTTDESTVDRIILAVKDYLFKKLSPSFSD